MNEIGELLAPGAVVLLVGERPGLATAESLSAYLAYHPRRGHTDANRNLVSNIHQNGVPLPEAATRILNLIQAMLDGRTSGVHLKERLEVPSMTLKIPGC
jgi:ethanolamine ammonia-lyase small subunit